MRLYVSDLDGTLLNNQGTLDKGAAVRLNRLIDGGARFCAATARTAATAAPILSQVHINVPTVLMNGAAVYDLSLKKYIQIETLPNAALAADTARRHGISGFVYSVCQNRLIACYDSIANEGMRAFYEERRQKYNKRFTKVNNLSAAVNDGTLYFSFLNTYSALLPLYDDLQGIDGIKTEFYRDIYSPDLWYLELLSASASKCSGVDFVRRYIGADEVIGFGDNYNDLSLFKACSVRCAVENAADELKKAADVIVGSNVDFGVIKYIEQCEKM